MLRTARNLLLVFLVATLVSPQWVEGQVGVLRAARALLADGTSSAPAYSWANDADLGLYRIGADEVGFAGNWAFRGPRPWVDVRAKGASPTATAAVNGTAITDALAAGDHVLISAGTYNTTEIILTANKHLIGAGVGVTTLKLGNSLNTNVIEIAAAGEADVAGWSIENMTIDGNEVNQTDGGTDREQNAIYAQMASSFAIRNVEVKNAFYSGLTLNSVKYAAVGPVWATGNRDNGFLITANDTDDNHRNKYSFFGPLYASANGKGAAVTTGAYVGVVLITLRWSRVEAYAFDNGRVTTTGNANFLIQGSEYSQFQLVGRDAFHRGLEFRGTNKQLDITANIEQSLRGDAVVFDVAGAILTHSRLKIYARNSFNRAIYLNGTATYNEFTGVLVNSLNGTSLVEIDGTSDFNHFHDMVMRDDQGTPTTPRGVLENAGADHNRFEDNHFAGFTVTPITLSGASSVARNNKGYITEANVLSGTFAIDSTGIKTVTIAHGLSYTPSAEQCQLTPVEVTDVDDWAFNLLKIESVGATNVVVKINVSTASATGAATAKLALRCTRH